MSMINSCSHVYFFFSSQRSPCSEQSSHTRSRVYPRSSAIGKNLQSERQVRRAVVDSCDIGGDRRLERLVALEERLQREKQAFEWRKRDEEQVRLFFDFRILLEGVVVVERMAAMFRIFFLLFSQLRLLLSLSI